MENDTLGVDDRAFLTKLPVFFVSNQGSIGPAAEPGRGRLTPGAAVLLTTEISPGTHAVILFDEQLFVERAVDGKADAIVCAVDSKQSFIRALDDFRSYGYEHVVFNPLAVGYRVRVITIAHMLEVLRGNP